MAHRNGREKHREREINMLIYLTKFAFNLNFNDSKTNGEINLNTYHLYSWKISKFSTETVGRNDGVTETRIRVHKWSSVSVCL